MNRFEKLYRAAVLLLLAANLAVSCVVCVRLGSNTASVGAVPAAASAPAEELPAPATELPAPVTDAAPPANAFLYSYDWAVARFDHVSVEQMPADEYGDWHFRFSIPGGSADLTLQAIYINNLVNGNLTEEVTDPVWTEHMAELNWVPSGRPVVLTTNGSLVWEDAHPYVDSFNGREYRFVFEGSGQTVVYSYIFELLAPEEGSLPAGNTPQNATAPAMDYSADQGQDLYLLRHGADYAIETFPGVYWVPAASLGVSRYTNAEIYAMLSDTPEQKQASISTLYEALQLYQIGDFRSADDNIRIRENGIDWEHHTPGRQAVLNNCGCCATDSAWLRYLLDGDYDELGYISTSQRDGSGHIYNYIRQGEWYYIIDLTHYRNDWISTVEENGDMNAYMQSDRVLGNIHRTRDLNCFADYVQSAFSDPPGLMFRLTCAEAPAIDSVRGDTIVITHPESFEPYISVLFDDPGDSLTHAYAPDPQSGPSNN